MSKSSEHQIVMAQTTLDEIPNGSCFGAWLLQKRAKSGLGALQFCLQLGEPLSSMA